MAELAPFTGLDHENKFFAVDNDFNEFYLPINDDKVSTCNLLKKYSYDGIFEIEISAFGKSLIIHHNYMTYHYKKFEDLLQRTCKY